MLWSMLVDVMGYSADVTGQAVDVKRCDVNAKGRDANIRTRRCAKHGQGDCQLLSDKVTL